MERASSSSSAGVILRMGLRSGAGPSPSYCRNLHKIKGAVLYNAQRLTRAYFHDLLVFSAANDFVLNFDCMYLNWAS